MQNEYVWACFFFIDQIVNWPHFIIFDLFWRRNSIFLVCDDNCWFQTWADGALPLSEESNWSLCTEYNRKFVICRPNSQQHNVFVCARHKPNNTTPARPHGRYPLWISWDFGPKFQNTVSVGFIFFPLKRTASHTLSSTSTVLQTPSWYRRCERRSWQLGS